MRQQMVVAELLTVALFVAVGWLGGAVPCTDFVATGKVVLGFG